MRLITVFLLLPGIPAGLMGQAIVEHAAAASAATAAGAVTTRKTAGAISEALKRLDRTAASATRKTAVTAEPTRQAMPSTAATAPAAPAKVYEDAANIQPGLSADELRRRFGPAALSVSGEDGGQTLYYSRKDGTQIAVRMVDGCVQSVL